MGEEKAQVDNPVADAYRSAYTAASREAVVRSACTVGRSVEEACQCSMDCMFDDVVAYDVGRIVVELAVKGLCVSSPFLSKRRV